MRRPVRGGVTINGSPRKMDSRRQVSVVYFGRKRGGGTFTDLVAVNDEGTEIRTVSWSGKTLTYKSV